MKEPSIISRKKFVTTGLAALTATAVSASVFPVFFQRTGRIKAIAFDAFPIFDPRPVFTMVDAMFPEKGKELSNAWRSSQFEYCWLRTAGGKYSDFRKVTEDALIFAAAKTGVTLSDSNRETLVAQYSALNAWPDVVPVLDTLKQNGIRLSFLSNFTAAMLNANIRNAKLDGYFEEVISTDRKQTYKPDPKAYQLGIDVLKLKKEEILFTAFAGWDACGSKWFGYPTFWMNRQSAPQEELQATPDAVEKTMTALLNFIQN